MNMNEYEDVARDDIGRSIKWTVPMICTYTTLYELCAILKLTVLHLLKHVCMAKTLHNHSLMDLLGGCCSKLFLGSETHVFSTTRVISE